MRSWLFGNAQMVLGAWWPRTVMHPLPYIVHTDLNIGHPWTLAPWPFLWTRLHSCTLSCGYAVIKNQGPCCRSRLCVCVSMQRFDVPGIACTTIA